METKMETEHNVLTADTHDGLSCTVLLSLGLRLFLGELAFSRTSRLGSIIIIGNVTCFGVQLLGLV